MQSSCQDYFHVPLKCIHNEQCKKKKLTNPKQDAADVAVFLSSVVNDGVCCNPTVNYKATDCMCTKTFSSKLEEAPIACVWVEKQQQQGAFDCSNEDGQACCCWETTHGKMYCYNMPRSKSLYPICIHLYARLMAYGRGAITMMDKHVKDSSHPKIGLIGHASNACADTELKEKLHGHFQKAHRKGSTLHNANCANNGQQCRCWCVDV